MKIREIVQTDHQAYTQLRSCLDGESFMWGAGPGERESLGDYAGHQFDTVLGRGRSTIFVAEQEATMVGFLSLETPLWQSLAGTTTLMVGVLASHQGKGIAAELFERAHLWAADKGIHRIELLVFTDNVLAIGLYKKMGYIEEGVRKQGSYLDGQFVDESYMAKLLK